MNNVKVAAALNTISLAFGELAEALTENATAPVSARPDASPEAMAARFPEASPFEPVQPLDDGPLNQGSLSVCPKHKVAFTDGSYGPYCQQTTDDPAWGKAKGDKVWCRITPKNAAEWLRITAA